MKLKVKIEQVVDFYLNEDSMESVGKEVKKLLKENTPHVCVGGFGYMIASRNRVKIISIKKGKRNVKI